MTCRELPGALEGPIGNDRCANALANETLERELRHFAGTEDHRPSAGERSEDLLRELHRRRADRRGTSRYRGLRSHAPRHRQCRLKEPVEDGARGCPAVLPGVPNLSVDLRLAEHHRIET